MLAKRDIQSLLMLMLILIGGGGVCTQYISLCHCHTTTYETNHHDCCHCEDHDADCDTHRFALDHECSKGRNLSVVYVAASTSSNINTFSSTSNAGVKLSYMSAAQGADHEAIKAIITSIQHTAPWLDDKLKDLFDPSTAALRAPPVLV